MRRKILKAITTALSQSLKDRYWRPLACEGSLFRDYKIAGKNFLCRKFMKAIPTALTQSLKACDWRPFGVRQEFIQKL